MSLNKIFFSYSRNDASDFTLQLAVDLKKESFNVWIDQQDIRAGSEWDLEIAKALETCDCLLFIESEKSVTSSNVLDEVYYALEQRKKVIPIIYHDSKTPFRLQRLQHVDFTKDYERGLANLINELKRDSTAELFQTADKEELEMPVKSFFTKYSRYLLIIGPLLIIAAVAIVFFVNHKKQINKQTDKIVNSIDTLNSEEQSAVVESNTTSKKEGTANEQIVEKKRQTPDSNKITDKPNKKAVNKTDNIVPVADNKIENSVETFSGNWELADVEPKAASIRGHLKIEAIEEKKVKIQSHFQFYFFKKGTTAFFTVFNGFAACSSCVLQNEITITDRDIAFGTNKYEILKEDQPDGGKAGDTILDYGANNSIRAFVTLHLINKNTVIIRVQQSTPTPIANELVVEPFVYSFRFRKSN